MKGKAAKVGLAVLILAVVCTIAGSQDPPRDKKTNGTYVHDENEAPVRVEKPGDKPGDPPSDAIIIFDGKNTDGVCDEGMKPTKWIINDEGALECTKKAGTVHSRQEFGSIQLHIEFATPKAVSGSGQGRGNSGVFLQGIYELQVLD